MLVAAPLLQRCPPREDLGVCAGLPSDCLHMATLLDLSMPTTDHTDASALLQNEVLLHCCGMCSRTSILLGNGGLAGALVVLHRPHDNVPGKSTIAVTITKWSSFLTLPAMCNSPSRLAVSFKPPRTSQGQLPLEGTRQTGLAGGVL